jgi:hypothetical protein
LIDGGKTMDIINLLKEAVNYPLTDYKGWVMVAILTLILGIFQQLGRIYPDFLAIFGILSLIVAILLMGVNLSIIKATLQGENEIPMMDPVKNFVDGLKTFVVNVVYYVIPSILVFIISIIAGVYSNTEKFILSLNTTALPNGTASNVLSTVPSDVTNALFISVAIVAILAFVLFILFALLNLIAQARLAETGDILEAINIKYVIDKISSIGWGNYVLFIVGLFFTVCIVAFISTIVSIIPYIGVILSYIILESYILIVIARAVGLIYKA